MIKFTSLVIPITKFRKNKVIIPKSVAERVQEEIDAGKDLTAMISKPVSVQNLPVTPVLQT